MRSLGRVMEKADHVEGVWRTYAKAKGDEAAIEFYVLPIPAGEERRIDAKFFGRERKVTHGEDGRIILENTEKKLGYHAERALHACGDCRTEIFVTIEDEGAAAKFTELIGSEVKVGRLVLDSKLRGIEGSAKALKELLFFHLPEVAVWISQEAAKLRVTAAEGEEGKEKS